jgi:hypothetical protein
MYGDRMSEKTTNRVDASLVMLLLVTVAGVAFLISQLI